jgi:choice-of-anchor B domain-containing protein
MKLLPVLAFLTILAFAYSELHCTGDCQIGDEDASMNKVMQIKRKQWEECALEGECPNTKVHTTGRIACVDGYAGEYECCNVDLLSFVSLEDLGSGGDGNDIWGWVDPTTEREYAIVGTYDGTSFVDITHPEDPCVIGFLPTHTVGSSWRDIKVYKDWAFIVSEARTHGMQGFDLTQLRGLPCVPVLSSNLTGKAVPQLEESVHYGEFGNCHNVAINEQSGFAYCVGSGTCRSGLHMVDIRNPAQPLFAGCYPDDGYVHDTQCVIYDGPDERFKGKEICFCYDEDSLTIVDVTTKSNPVTLSITRYAGSQYTHQGWLLPGSQYLLLDDELDELYNDNHHTRTLVWDVSDLTIPVYLKSFYSSLEVIDHNLYTLRDRAYSANYCGGLRILDTSKVASEEGVLTEAGFFDVSPDCNDRRFLGSWSNYPYFPSGNIVVSSIDRGLFVVRYNGRSGGC